MQTETCLVREDWRGYQRDTFPTGSWVYQEDMLRAVATAPRIDLISRQQYGDFILDVEWCVARGGNSGILYHVAETMPQAWQSGPEMQLLDDVHHADGQTPETRCGALYGLLAPRRPVVRPHGHFNTARIVARGRRVEHWLNGELVLVYDLSSATFAAAVARSKFRDVPGFAGAAHGHIVLQHHGDDVWFRHLRIRPWSS